MIGENVYREIINHRSLWHPNIIQFIEVILTLTHSCNCDGLCGSAAGGELFDRIVDRGRFSEDEARYFFQQLICGVSYCHHMQICHRDLKLENVLLDGSSALRLKICDFGYSKAKTGSGDAGIYCTRGAFSTWEYDSKLNLMIHSIVYWFWRIRPNIDVPWLADVWSCGVTFYVMLVGAYPFEDQDDPKNIRKTIQRIAAIQYKIPDHIHISADCRQLISRIFVSNPLRRITMREIKSYPWFLKNLLRELTEAAQSIYYRRDNSVPAFSDQTTGEIMKIAKEARSVPKSSRLGYGYGDECSDDEGKEQENEPKEEDEMSVIGGSGGS